MDIEDIYNEDGKINMEVFFYFLKLNPKEFEKFKNDFAEGDKDFKNIKSYLFTETNNKKTSKEKCDFLILALRQLTDLKFQYEARVHEKWTVVEKANNTPSKQPIFEKLISFCNGSLDIYTKLAKLEGTIPQTETKILQKLVISEAEKSESYSQKQIAIAYYIMGVTLNEKNVKGILEKHSKTKSMKILQKLVTKNSQLTSLLDSKTANTKHLNDLKEAKRLLSGIKNKKAITDIDRIITAFKTSYENKY
jgi:hypothetical protein